MLNTFNSCVEGLCYALTGQLYYVMQNIKGEVIHHNLIIIHKLVVVELYCYQNDFLLLENKEVWFKIHELQIIF